MCNTAIYSYITVVASNQPHLLQIPLPLYAFKQWVHIWYLVQRINLSSKACWTEQKLYYLYKYVAAECPSTAPAPTWRTLPTDEQCFVVTVVVVFTFKHLLRTNSFWILPSICWNGQSRAGGGANVQCCSYCLINLPLLVLTWYRYQWWDRYYWCLDQSTHHYRNLVLATSTTRIFSWLLAITAPWKPQMKKQRWR